MHVFVVAKFRWLIDRPLVSMFMAVKVCSRFAFRILGKHIFEKILAPDLASAQNLRFGPGASSALQLNVLSGAKKKE